MIFVEVYENGGSYINDGQKEKVFEIYSLGKYDSRKVCLDIKLL